MKLLLAPQEFKGSLTSREACAAMAAGSRRALPAIEIDELPLSDGGSGLVDALVTARQGSWRTAHVSDPLGRPVTAQYGLIDGGRTAVIELAAASGLALLRLEELDPLQASSFGTGELIRAALEQGVRDFIIGIGGSATNDGGAGIAEALGVRLLDADGEPVGRGGAALSALDSVDVSGLDPRILYSRVVVASDVRNPLFGPDGASAVYGPQKGASGPMVSALDQSLRRYAQVIEHDLKRDVSGIPGAGAAGGAGAGLIAFLQAELRPGFALVAEATRLHERLRQCDLALTGEGRLDGQSAMGKGTGALAEVAAGCGVPLIALVGGLGVGFERALASGVTATFSIVPGPVPLQEAMAGASGHLAACTEAVLKTVVAGMQLMRRRSLGP